MTPPRVSSRIFVRSTGFAWDDWYRMFEPALESLPGRPWEETRAALREVLVQRYEQDDRLRQAVLWQDPAVLKDIVPKLRRPQSTPPVRSHRRERVLTRYLQRYHTRNETIGFFGPARWTQVNPAGPMVSLPEPVPAQPLTVTVESWAVATLARHWADQPDLGQHLGIWHADGLWTSGTTAISDGRRYRLSPTALRVLDAARTAHSIAEIARTAGLHESEAATEVRRLAEDGLLVRRLRVSTDIDCWQDLRSQLLALPAGRGRADALEEWSGLDAAIRHTERAADAETLRDALAAVDDRFVHITGATSRRSATVVRGRSVLGPIGTHTSQVTFGPQLREQIQTIFTVLRPAIRWFRQRAQERLLAHWRAEIAELTEAWGTDTLPLGSLYESLYATLEEASFWTPVQHEFWRRAAAVLSTLPDGTLALATLDDPAADERALAEMFPLEEQEGGTWGSALLHSPDVMIAAADPDALAAGDFRLVIGETHLCTVTADDQVGALLPDGPQMLRDLYADLGPTPVPRVFVLPECAVDETSLLNDPVPYRADDESCYLTTGPEHAVRHMHPRRVWPMADCTVRADREHAGLVSLPDGSTIPLIQVLGEALSHTISSKLSWIDPEQCSPRVLVGRHVLCRQAVVVAGARLSAQIGADEEVTHRRIRELLRAEGVPRWSFWQPDRSVKPMLLDRNNPLTLDLLVADVARDRGASRYRFVEMMPGPDDLWLPGNDGRPVTCEFRITLAECGPEDRPMVARPSVAQA